MCIRDSYLIVIIQHILNTAKIIGVCHRMIGRAIFAVVGVDVLYLASIYLHLKAADVNSRQSLYFGCRLVGHGL